MISFSDDGSTLITMEAINMAFTYDSRYLIGVLRTGTLRVWELNSSKTQKIEFRVGGRCVCSALF